MIAVNSFRIHNLRSIEDSGDIRLKPITILVGRNSSGKSTMARIFPLLRQSAEATKRGPILWWGRLVDFGSFDEAVNRYSAHKEIGLDFKLSFDPDDLRATTRRGLGRLSMLRLLQPGEIDISLRFKSGDSGSYTSKISISMFDFCAIISLDQQGFVTEISSGTYVWRPSNQIICFGPQDRLIPNPSFFKSITVEGESAWESFDPFRTEIPRVIRSFVHGNTAEERVRQLANKIPLGCRSDIFRQLCQVANPPTFRDSLKDQGESSSIFNRLCDLSFVSQLDVILEQANTSLNSLMSEVIYLEPLRATAQRYYRRQSLAVEEIDSKGENIAMFLDSLSYAQKLDFKAWTSKHFGIEVEPKKDGGHISLRVKQIAGGAEANIADMGFGFSQMLPIAAQLWAASAARSTALPSRKTLLQPLIVIEQPELHLHPDYQAKLADVFVAALGDRASEESSNRLGLRIFAETHSPALINRLGMLVAEGIVHRNNVQVVIFEQEDSSFPSQVKIAEFDAEGILRNWPLGFFEPSSLS